ncbi:tagaturonate reductase [Vibrio mangrovi]|uniref:Altronate oxidoreductase n=1 Tax=Vibrio mangrovi TaxID=474394 RepID=A0A1Y6IYW2_9VIBR|nr:tagaturonate reductase [Vibrio mangrovi]MDW6002678.1 tagaturonate reductase [Vibrio mangrovi]SMS02837.1 Altronate oxidoreductase [Vibrio mangrovi]
MKQLNRENFPGPSYPTRIIQFGEGNFLRAFLDWQIDQLNECTSLNSGVSVIRPIDSNVPPSLNTQQGIYTTLIRGLDDTGHAVSQSRVIYTINEELSAYHDFAQLLTLAKNPQIQFVFSNTTEAGIAYVESDQIEDTPPASFPAKLTRMLWERFNHFAGAGDKGWVIIPCELIDYNGEVLKSVILRYAKHWQLPEEFREWIETANTFCSTLVDRIVTGYPREEAAQLEEQLNYRDNFLVSAEHFYLFVIQGPQWLSEKLCLDQLPPEKALNIRVVADIKPYKERKVAILNGAHTALVPVAFLSGLETVGESMADPQMAAYLEEVIFSEIIPTLTLPADELQDFARDVQSRFRNPYIRHQLLSIALNSMSKFKTRILPQLLNFQRQQGKLPHYLTFALAALIVFYRGERQETAFPLNDEQEWIDFFASEWSRISVGQSDYRTLVERVLGCHQHWECDLTQVPGLTETVAAHVERICHMGMREALANA